MLEIKNAWYFSNHFYCRSVNEKFIGQFVRIIKRCDQSGDMVYNLLTKCAKILAKNLGWAIIAQIFCDVSWGFRPGPGLFL